jgi:hypothetical protein
MIAYDLRCANGHAFEGWFEDAGAFLGQKKRGLVACPVCNVTDVAKLPSKFAIKTSAGLRPRETPEPDARALARVGKQIAEFVEKNFDDVGCNFATEALKIHYGVSEPRNIRGVSTLQEEKTLQEEGIPFVKVPMPARSETES